MLRQNIPPPTALWCLIGADRLLVRKVADASLDRAVRLLPRFSGSSSDCRASMDKFLEGAGLDGVRKPLLDLGEVLCGEGHGATVATLQAMQLSGAGSFAHARPAGLELISLTELRTEAGSRAEGSRVWVEALIWAGAHLFFSRPGSGGRPRDYEVFGSLSLYGLRDDYFNQWFPDAVATFEALGISIDIDSLDAQPSLRIQGRSALQEENIYLVQARLFDLGRHAKVRFWITQVIDGEESVQDFADPQLGSKLLPSALASST